jgi:hypothetical protein
MVRPEDAKQRLDEHFGQVSLEEFKDRHERYAERQDSAQPWIVPDTGARDAILSQRQATPLRLNAYFATALTSLTQEERDVLFAVADVVVAVSEEMGIGVYKPWEVTDPVQHPEVPAEVVFSMDRERVLDSDLVIHIADYASTGAGEELDFALAALIPIVLLSRGDAVVSRMVLGIPGLKLRVMYNTLDELRAELREVLGEIRPVLEQRKLSFSDFDNNIVGNKVRVMREESYLTREELASSSMGLLTVERLRVIEESGDKVSNPSLLELRALSTFLKTTVADLAEPDLKQRILVMLNEWLDGGSDARYGMSRNDRNKILTRLLLRIADDLQRE